MNKEALNHQPFFNYIYAKRKNCLEVRFRTAKNDVNEVNLYYGVKYKWKEKKKVRMVKLCQDEYFDYFHYLIEEEDVRLGYYFEVIDEIEHLFYTEAGIFNEFDDKRAHCLFFQYPAYHEIDQIKKPSWSKEAIFYQIFVERFCRGGNKTPSLNLVEWEAEPTPQSFHGGDLKGIISKLDYLSEIGVNALYLTPIFESISNHKYDIKDYKKIDTQFGTNDDLKKLVEQAHARNIKIVLDAVFNHCSEEFPPFQDVVRLGEQSKYKDWFYIKEFPVSKKPLNYEVFATVPYMPRLNTSNKEVKNYLYEVALYWMENFDIDGWRLDVADEPDHLFWKEFRKVVKDYKKDILIIGEVWHDSTMWLMGDQFDTVMNYSVTNVLVDYIANQNINALVFSERLAGLLMRYPDVMNEMMFNLIESHDTERFLYLCDGKKERLKLAYAFLFSYLGIPCSYYGSEVGVTGGYDPGCRRTFPWNRADWDMDLWEYYKRLIQVRKKEEALKQGLVEFFSTKELFVMARTYQTEKIYVVINNTENEHSLSNVLKNERYIELITEKELKSTIIPPMTAYYLKELVSEDKIVSGLSQKVLSE